MGPLWYSRSGAQRARSVWKIYGNTFPTRGFPVPGTRDPYDQGPKIQGLDDPLDHVPVLTGVCSRAVDYDGGPMCLCVVRCNTDVTYLCLSVSLSLSLPHRHKRDEVSGATCRSHSALEALMRSAPDRGA
jgi:hypothetical protein